MRVSESQTFHIVVWRNGNEFRAQFSGRAEAGSLADIALALDESLYPPDARLLVDLIGFEATEEADRLLAELTQSSLIVSQDKEMLTGALIGLAEETGSPAGVSRPWWQVHSYNLPTDGWVCAFARARAQNLAVEAGLTSLEADDLMLAVGEAVANAIKYGCTNDVQPRIRLRYVVGPDVIEVKVSDTGPGFDPLLVKPTGLSPGSGGHGLGLMNTAVDEVVFSYEDGMSIRLVKYLKWSDGAGD
jgi:anti-sigma regulatory factor (Ser/Thr protein kinase)